jgi:hypothetical protein
MNEVIEIVLGFFLYLIIQLLLKKTSMLKVNIKNITGYFANKKNIYLEILLVISFVCCVYPIESVFIKNKLINVKLSSVLLVTCIYYIFLNINTNEETSIVAGSNIIINKNIGFIVFFYSIYQDLIFLKVISVLLLVFLLIIEVVQKNIKRYVFSSEVYFYFCLLVLSMNLGYSIYYFVLVFQLFYFFIKNYISVFNNNINKILYPFYVLILGGLLVV